MIKRCACDLTTEKGYIMEFIKTNIDTTNKKDVYRMTKGDSLRIQDLEKGLSLPIDKWAIYMEDKVKRDGSTEPQKVLSFVSGGTKYGTISGTFISSFEDVVEIMDGEPFAIIITGGTSKGGRPYVNCELDCDF